MPQATHTHTPSTSCVVTGTLVLSLPDVDGSGGTPLIVSLRPFEDEGDLLNACQAVAVRKDALDILMRAVADISPSDPRHEASYAVVERLRPDWLQRVSSACAIPARGSRGLTAKAALLSSLIERDEGDAVQGGPALQLAASLAGDVLVRDWS